MNILPKKRWHVRTKENIARVRRDEALAAEQEKIEQSRIQKAESEARLAFLKNQNKKHFEVDSSSNEQVSTKHINFFEELEKGEVGVKTTNKDFEKSQKEEQEKYEKQIGLLTYLGDGCKEEVSKCWYNKLPKRISDLTEPNVEIGLKKKQLCDPLNDIKKFVRTVKSNRKDNKNASNSLKLEVADASGSRPIITDTHKILYKESKKDKEKHKKHKKVKKHKHKEKHKLKEITTKIDIQKLRTERLLREKQEKLKAEALLADLGSSKKNRIESKLDTDCNTRETVFKQKYNSQFFPELARQNYSRKY